MIDKVIYILINNKWLEIPTKHKRQEIIEKAHLLGHFNITTTIERIKEIHYWKNITRDVETYISKCINCLRNKKFINLEHPARALKVTFIFERIGMDIVSGLPVTNSKYSKILVIAEYLSKMIRIYPLVTKTAEEVPENLWRYISQYGPPKTILSDQGKEFVNNIIEKILITTGIERTSILQHTHQELTDLWNARIKQL
jgi:hypothetical protein